VNTLWILVDFYKKGLLTQKEEYTTINSPASLPESYYNGKCLVSSGGKKLLLIYL
jgi:hypothetical protein